MRVVFCGSGSLAAPALKAVMASPHEVAAIITQPARPAGRGGKLRRTPLALVAEEAGAAVIECADINSPESADAIRTTCCDVICVVDFGQLVRKHIRQIPRHEAFNVHASLLPELRGAAPVNWAIIRGHERTGVTTFRMVGKMDAGDIYLQRATNIEPDETAEQLKSRLGEMGARLACETLDLLQSGPAQPQPQDESAVTLAPKLQKSDGVIDWTAGAVEIRNRIHGTWPWPGGQARFMHAGAKSVDVIIARAAASDEPASAGVGGIEQDTSVATGNGRLRIIEIKPTGRRLMNWRDFVNGYRVQPGDMFVQAVI